MNVKLALMNLCLKYGSSSSLLLDSVVCSCFPPIAVGEFIFFFQNWKSCFYLVLHPLAAVFGHTSSCRRTSFPASALVTLASAFFGLLPHHYPLDY